MAQSSQNKYPRDLAVRVLTRVLSEREPLDEALAAVSGEISGDGRAWLQEICSGTLRWKGRIDQALDSIALKKKPSGWLRKALSIAAYQLIVQERVSPAQIVSEAVDQIKRKEGEAPAKFGNALLRKVAEQGARWKALPFPAKADLAQQAQWASLPEWLWKKLVEQHGAEWAQAYAVASLERPTLWFRAAADATIAPAQEDWAKPGPVPGSFQVVGASPGPVNAWPGFAEGKILIQDISSQRLVAEISAEASKQGARTALDLCAAPGGKSVGMAWSGLSVTATDRDPKRVALLKQSIERAAAGKARIVERDQVALLEGQDLVWVDSPCSGTGILRRHPDVRWLRKEGELEGLAKVQQEVIRDGWSKVKPGGLFAYSVCSVLKSEGPDAIARAGLAASGGEKLREWFLVPHEAPSGDGFWAILIRKTN